MSLEQDRRYRREGERYVEVCVECDRDRGDAERCACGAVFAKPTSNRLALAWTPTALRPQLPPICPHCEQPGTKVRSLDLALPTGLQIRASGLGVTDGRIRLEYVACPRAVSPLLAYFAILVAAFFAVVFGLAALFGTPAALVGLVPSLLGVVLGWRAYGWLRFVRFDHRSIRLRARRAGYARRVAELNRGRVL